MKRIKIYLKPFFLSVPLALGVALSANMCDEGDSPLSALNAKNWTVYTIKKGEHTSTSKVLLNNRSSLKFQCKFETNAQYTTSDPANQLDINKLYGFSDCGDNDHHQNSARFGWRWYNNKMEIHAYCYAEEQRNTKYITDVALDKEYTYEIIIQGSEYIFKLNGKTVVMDRGCGGDPGSKYTLYPYFGGDETAPHDIKIHIKEDY